MEIPNPVSTRVKVPVRLQEKIVACPEPVVGLDFVTELIAVSDPEMEPHYNCELCGRQVWYIICVYYITICTHVSSTV